ncbi:MAG: A/G-specific adenine glycosylase [Mailhella sp.]|nr:A/G-specific adenine glycosylase [Mailhella sp.]
MKKTFSFDAAQGISAALLRWFDVHKRPLPWRERYAPYEVWISEVMLQQTQMERGVTYFQRWMSRFPDIRSVAEATEEEILRHWEGLGYYRRARFLHQAAKAVVEKHGGELPGSKDALSALPGLGAYTVDAVLSIAFEQNVVPVDANVERVFSRLLDIGSPIRKKPAADIVKREALRLLPEGHARDYAQALMEFGALVCGKSPRCTECPLAEWCEAHRLGLERERPVKDAAATMVPVTSAHGIILCQKHVLLFQRPASGLWGNMWEFPGLDRVSGDPLAELLSMLQERGLKVEVLAPLGSVSHGYTNHRLTAHFFRLGLDEGLAMQDISKKLDGIPHRFVRWDSTGELAMPAHHRKMAERYFMRKVRVYAEQLHL